MYLSLILAGIKALCRPYVTPYCLAIMALGWTGETLPPQLNGGTKLKPVKNYIQEPSIPLGSSIRLITGSALREISRLDGFLVRNTLQGHSSSVWSVSFSPDGRTIGSASGDGVVKLWDLDGRELQTLEGHSDSVYSVSFSPDGQMLASASADGVIKFWDISGQELQILEGHSKGVHSVSFSPDGQTLASASFDRTVKLWDLDGRELQTLEGHSDLVYSVSFSPDGQTLASASGDGTVKLWDLERTESQTLRGHSRWVRSVSFNSDSLGTTGPTEIVRTQLIPLDLPSSIKEITP